MKAFIESFSEIIILGFDITANRICVADIKRIFHVHNITIPVYSKLRTITDGNKNKNEESLIMADWRLLSSMQNFKHPLLLSCSDIYEEGLKTYSLPAVKEIKSLFSDFGDNFYKDEFNIS